MSKRRRPKSASGDRQANLEPRPAGRNGQQSQTPQGPNESVIAQGPLAVTQSTAPVDAGEQGHAEASSLPSATVAGTEREEQQFTQASRGLRTGGTGVVAQAPTHIMGIRNLRMAKRLAGRSDWQMPAGCEESLPMQAFLIARNLKEEGGAIVPADYSPRVRLQAVRTLVRMEDANRRKLAAVVRLSQLERQTQTAEMERDLPQQNVRVHVGETRGPKDLLIAECQARSIPAKHLLRPETDAGTDVD